MRTGLPKSGVAPRRADITTPRCQSRAAAPRPRKRSRHPHITALIVAERRHSAITQYAERSRACRDSTHPCCRRAGGTPLLQSRSLTARAVSPPSLGASQMRYYPHSRSLTARAVSPPSLGASQMRYYPHSRSLTARAVTFSVNPRQRRGDIHREKTAEERFHMLARGWPAYPVTPVARATTAEVRL